jgi:hypothetical protein
VEKLSELEDAIRMSCCDLTTFKIRGYYVQYQDIYPLFSYIIDSLYIIIIEHVFVFI